MEEVSPSLCDSETFEGFWLHTFYKIKALGQICEKKGLTRVKVGNESKLEAV